MKENQLAKNKKLNLLRGLGKEFWIVTAMIFLIVLFFNANFLMSFFVHSPDKSFTGITGVSTIDYGVYFSMIEQVRQGSFLTKNLYSSETLAGGLFHPLWIGLGLLAKLVKTNSVTIFHLARIVSGIIFLYFLYFLSWQFIKKEKWRLVTLLGFGFAAGWGRWLSVFQKDYFQGGEVLRLLFGVDMWHSEAFVFLTLTHSPLFIVTQLFLILAWWLLTYKKPILNWLAGLSLLILGFMHPYDILIFWSVIAIWFVFKFFIKQDKMVGWLRRLMPSFLATVVLFLYYILLMINNPNIGGWFNQNVTLAPSFYAVLTGYGWLWLAAIYYLVYLFKDIEKLSEKYYWLIAWFVTLPLLEFAPVNFSRRFIQSFGVVMIIMAAMGLNKWWDEKGRGKWEKSKYGLFISSMAVILLLTVFVTPLYQGIEDIVESYNKTWPSYIGREELDVVTNMRNARSDSIILANPFLANILPGFSGRFVYYGHPHQTLNYQKKYAQAQRFYSIKWQDENKKFLLDNGIDYLIWPSARASEIPDYWNIWYENNVYKIYEIN